MIGFIGAFCTTVSFVPQAIKVIIEKKTESVSLGMYILQVVGLSLWLIHGFMINDMPLIISNIISVVLALIILVCKIIYK